MIEFRSYSPHSATKIAVANELVSTTKEISWIYKEICLSLTKSPKKFIILFPIQPIVEIKDKMFDNCK